MSEQPSLNDFLLARIAEDEVALEAAGQSIYRASWARMLDECQAKRQVVRLHGADHGNACGSAIFCGTCDNEYPCLTVRLIALPYQRDPDYCEEWKP